MSAVSVFGTWPPIPHKIGIATVNGAGVIQYQKGGCIASIVRAGVGQYEVNTVPGRIGGWATGLLSPANVQVTCVNLVSNFTAEVIATGANQLSVQTFNNQAAGALADSPFFIEFGA
jgi:hypothetical protein